METQEKEIKPTKDVVFVEFQPFIDRKTSSGLHVAKPKFEGVPNRGKVYAVADNVTDVDVGDFVVFKSERARGIKINGKKLIPVKIQEIMGIIADES